MGKPLDDDTEKTARSYFSEMPDCARLFIQHHLRNALMPLSFLSYRIQKGEMIKPEDAGVIDKALEHIGADIEVITQTRKA